jgi:dihydroneopterin aldolase
MDPTKYRRIFLRDYIVNIFIGVHDYEKLKPQRVSINVDVWVLLENTRSCKDDINEIFDYSYIKDSINSIVYYRNIELQETLGDLIIDKILEHPVIDATLVSTNKLDIYNDCSGIGTETFKQKNKIISL